MCRVVSAPNAFSQRHWLVPKSRLWNTPFRKLPEAPGGIGLSNVTVVLTLPEIVNVSAFEVPPPGAALNTVTDAVPAVAMSLAGIAAVTCAAETNVVVRALPFHCTVEPEMKLLPFTVSANVGPPAAAAAGLSPVVVGTGFVTGETDVFMSV